MHRALKTLAVVAPFLAAAAAGCGPSKASTSGPGGGSSESTSSSSGTGGSGPAATKACDDEAAAVCTLRNTCSPNYDVQRVYGTEAACQSRTAQTCVNSLDAMGQGNTPTKVEACATAYPTEMCSDFFDDNPTACPQVMGTLAMGAACGAPGQCTSGFCDVTEYAVCGTCQPMPAAGATCVVQADCGRDLACATPTISVADAGIPTSGLCAAYVASGGACLTGYKPCAAGLACVGDVEATMTTGICMAQGATVGAMCQTTRNTVANCDPDLGLVCIAPAGMMGMGTCVAITIVGPGKVCGETGGPPATGFAVCSASGLCVKAAPTDLSGTCKAAAADGAPCDNDPSIGPPCLAPAKCVIAAGSTGTAGTCTVPNAATCM
jgi:hypothetical protein